MSRPRPTPTTRPATAVDLSSSFVALGTANGADRAGVLGTTDAAYDADYYAFWLNAGQSLTVAVKGLAGATGYDCPVRQLPAIPWLYSSPGGGVDGVIHNLHRHQQRLGRRRRRSRGRRSRSTAWSSPAMPTSAPTATTSTTPRTSTASAPCWGRSPRGRACSRSTTRSTTPPFPIYPTDTQHRRLRHVPILGPRLDREQPVRPEHGLRRHRPLLQRRGLLRQQHDLQDRPIDRCGPRRTANPVPFGNFTRPRPTWTAISTASTSTATIYMIDPSTWTVTGTLSTPICLAEGLTGDPDNGHALRRDPGLPRNALRDRPGDR